MLINLSRTAVVVIAVVGALLAVNPSETILGLVLVMLATKAPSEKIQQEFNKAAKLDNLADAGGLDFDQAASKVD